MATLPSEKDQGHPEIGPFVEKYLKGVDSVQRLIAFAWQGLSKI